jgi:hypothetical protein
MREPTPVAVKWRDAYSGGEGWVSEYDDAVDDVVPVTVGFMLPPAFKPGFVVIADTFFDQPDGTRFYSGITYIPAGMVVDTTVMC